MENITKTLKKSMKYIRRYYSSTPKVGLILGSGLGVMADSLQNPLSIPYSRIPFFPVSTVKGHSNTLVFGEIHNLKVVVMKGRFHYYEEYPMEDITYPVRVLKELGIKVLVVTNAGGSVNPRFRTGDLMVLTDHINLMGDNPLRGWSREDLYPRFIDMTFGYNPEMIQVLKKAALKNKVPLRQGVYAAMTGPSYETPAEIRMLDSIGADAVGMSTVPEVIVANQLGLRVAGISLLTNMAAGILKKKLDHKEVLETSEKARSKFIKLIKGFLLELSKMEI
ncbi:MAG: purine-nucleoside phosphorylase [bacterium]|nr:purine-nucleoside phosphorylase [bacterium]